MYSLKNKVVAITGASSGIGKSLALEALAEGAVVAVCARNKEKLSGVFEKFNDDRILLIQADVSREDDCERFIHETIGKFGTIDVLINNAGISMRALFEDVEISVIKELMNVNFYGAVYCTKHALPYIKQQKGVIVGVSSIAGYRGLPARSGYSASKFALQGFLESLRTELLHTGVHVMWVSPGFTASNIRNTARSTDGTPQKENPLNESKLMTAEMCAKVILKSVKKRKRTVVMTAQGKLTVWANKLLAGFLDNQVYKHFLNEPDSPLSKYETND